MTVNVYVPGWENETCVLEEFGLLYVTPVPPATVQLYVRVPFGKPSSVAVAVSVVLAGSVIVTFGLALTTGAELTGLRLTCTWFEGALSCPLTLTAVTT